MDGSFSLGSPSSGAKGCGCAGACSCDCGCLPAEFVRLRYAYGLRLGAVELSDEQAYLVGKDRFHNVHGHGAGVLCGLSVGRFVWPQNAPAGTPTTVLRVSAGAALDECGREILVPCDQCIDVSAWFATNRGALTPAPVAGPLSIWVALRYRECPSDPAPVPRDPCGCDTGGCDYTRVRESFELRLFAGKAPDWAGQSFPTSKALKEALAGAVPGGDALLHELDTLTAQLCPVGADTWIGLAELEATLTPAGAQLTVSDLSTPDNAFPGRRPLLSAGALQALVLDLAGVATGSGMVGAGPTMGGLSFTGASATTGVLTIAIDLITDAPSTAPTALAAGTFDPATVQVQQFDTTAWTWRPVTPATIAISADGAGIDITWGGGDPPLAAGDSYRVSMIQSAAAPLVDQRMRAALPASFARDFSLSLDTVSNVLTLAPVTL